MTESEKLLSAFSENYFFKEMVVDNLLFTPEGRDEIELADLIINLQDYIIAIQLKSRNEKDQTFDREKEKVWLNSKCKRAKEQVKSTLKYISSGTLPAFKNKQNQAIAFSENAEVIPLVVFVNAKIDTYPHLLRKHSDSGMDINCMSFDDYKEMCEKLISPIEIVLYLKYRKDFYEKYGECDFAIFDDLDDKIYLTIPHRDTSLVLQFLNEFYGIDEAEQHMSKLQFFRHFLHQMPKQITHSSAEDGSFNLITFFSHLDRCEVSAFLECLEDTKERSQKGETGMLHSLRRDDGSMAMVFVAGEALPIAYIRELVVVKSPKEIRQVLEVIINWIDNEQYCMDFWYRDETREEG